MLLTIVIVLLVLWALGLFAFHVTGAVIHILLIAALVCGFLAVQSDVGTASDGKGPTVALGTPLWSPRRVPEPFVDLVGAQKLQATLDQAVAGTDACFAVNAASEVATSTSALRPRPVTRPVYCTAALPTGEPRSCSRRGLSGEPDGHRVQEADLAVVEVVIRGSDVRRLQRLAP